jgi:hypothetical protein
MDFTQLNKEGEKMEYLEEFERKDIEARIQEFEYLVETLEEKLAKAKEILNKHKNDLNERKV